MSQLLSERRDLELEKLRQRFAPKLAKLQERIQTAEDRVQREESQYDRQKMQTAISFGATLLGAVLGRKLGSARNVGRATTAARSATRVAREKQDVAKAKRDVKRLRGKLHELEEQFEEKIERVRALPSIIDLELDPVPIRSRKADISVTQMALAWIPWRKAERGWSEAFAISDES